MLDAPRPSRGSVFGAPGTEGGRSTDRSVPLVPVDTPIVVGGVTTDVVASDGPTVIRSIAVHATDVVTAYEAVTRSSASIVLRITPPFHARMRARLHRRLPDAVDESTGAVLLDPRSLVDEDRIPPYPEPAGTERDLRADPTVEFTMERHHERHVSAIADWRQTARSAIVDSVTLPTDDGDHRVSVRVLDGD